MRASRATANGAPDPPHEFELLCHSRQAIRRVFIIVACGVILPSCGPADSQSSDIARMADGRPYSKRAYYAGRTDAERDIREGRLIVEDYGFPPKGQAEYAAILQQRCNVELKRVAGDIVDAKAIGHAKGYNEVSETVIKSRFGENILGAAAAEAERLEE